MSKSAKGKFRPIKEIYIPTCLKSNRILLKLFNVTYRAIKQLSVRDIRKGDKLISKL